MQAGWTAPSVTQQPQHPAPQQPAPQPQVPQLSMPQHIQMPSPEQLFDDTSSHAQPFGSIPMADVAPSLDLHGPSSLTTMGGPQQLTPTKPQTTNKTLVITAVVIVVLIVVLGAGAIVLLAL